MYARMHACMHACMHARARTHARMHARKGTFRTGESSMCLAQVKRLVELPRHRRAWLIGHPRREVVFDACTSLTLAREDFVRARPIPIVHPSYMRFLRYGEGQPLLVQV